MLYVVRSICKLQNQHVDPCSLVFFDSEVVVLSFFLCVGARFDVHVVNQTERSKFPIGHGLRRILPSLQLSCDLSVQRHQPARSNVCRMGAAPPLGVNWECTRCVVHSGCDVRVAQLQTEHADLARARRSKREVVFSDLSFLRRFHRVLQT